VAGNEPAEREGVLDAIDELTRAGMLDARGSDFYMLTERGKRTIAPS
jgi:Mn-dependent DtxR family transcriptional regulator